MSKYMAYVTMAPNEENFESVWNVTKDKLQAEIGLGNKDQMLQIGRTATEWMLTSDKPWIRKAGLEIFSDANYLANRNDVLDECASGSLKTLLEKVSAAANSREPTTIAVSGGIEYVKFLELYLKTFRDGGSVNWDQNCLAVRRLVCFFVAQKCTDINELRLVSEMLLTYPECVPTNEHEARSLCSLVIRFVATLNPYKNCATVTQKAAEYKNAVATVPQVTKLVKFVWNQPGMGFLLEHSLRQLYSLLVGGN
jgi:hypothetical protein